MTTKPLDDDMDFERIAELDAADASDARAAPDKKTFRPKKIKETLEQCDLLIANYHKQIASMGELKRALVHECTKHFDDPEVRAAYIEIRIAELAARGVTVDERSRLKSLKPYPRVISFNPELEYIAKQIKAAREYVRGQQEQGVP